MPAQQISQQSSPSSATVPRPSRPNGRFVSAIICSVVIGLLIGGYTGWRFGYKTAADRRRQLPNGSILCKSGPWGDLSYIPFTIAAPNDLLPTRTIETTGTRWLLKGMSSDAFVALIQGTSMTMDQRRAWLDGSVLHAQEDGVLLTPGPDLVFGLPTDAREKLYGIVSQFTENESQFSYIPKSAMGSLFSTENVSSQAASMFKQLCCERGDYEIFSGMSAVLSKLNGYDDKVHFVKALTAQPTMLLRLHVTPQSDIEALVQYWGRGAWNTDVRTILKSMAQIKDGTWMNILMVLPPLPTAEIYTYPNITDNPMDGPPVNRDCHWTSLNFFRDVPDPNFGKGDFVFREIKDNYFPIPGDPRYGDLVLFTKPDGSVIHSAIFIADDICYTKNGGTSVHPWMLSSMDDLLKQYTCQVPQGDKLTVSYMRQKRL